MENLLYLKSRQLKLKNITPCILQAPKDQPFGLEQHKVLEIDERNVLLVGRTCHEPSAQEKHLPSKDTTY